MVKARIPANPPSVLRSPKKTAFHASLAVINTTDHAIAAAEDGREHDLVCPGRVVDPSA
jgi:hypothetical protein